MESGQQAVYRVFRSQMGCEGRAAFAEARDFEKRDNAPYLRPPFIAPAVSRR